MRLGLQNNLDESVGESERLSEPSDTVGNAKSTCAFTGAVNEVRISDVAESPC